MEAGAPSANRFQKLKAMAANAKIRPAITHLEIRGWGGGIH